MARIGFDNRILRRISHLSYIPQPTVNFPGSYVRDVNTKATCFVLHLQVMLDCIGAQCGRQEAWTTVDPALIRGLVPHDQGSSRGFLCLANARRHQACTNLDRGFPNLPILPSALGVEDYSRYGRVTSLVANPFCAVSPSGELGLDHTGDRPDETDQLASDRHDHLGCRLAGGNELAVAR